MIGREKRVLLRHYLERGMTKSTIARQLGISRRTVYHWIKTGQLDRELDDLAVSLVLDERCRRSWTPTRR